MLCHPVTRHKLTALLDWLVAYQLRNRDEHRSLNHRNTVLEPWEVLRPYGTAYTTRDQKSLYSLGSGI